MCLPFSHKPLGIFCKILHSMMGFKNTYVASSGTDCMLEHPLAEKSRELSLLLGLKDQDREVVSGTLRGRGPVAEGCLTSANQRPSVKRD